MFVCLRYMEKKKYKSLCCWNCLCNSDAICTRFLRSCCSSIRASLFDALKWFVEYTLCVCVCACRYACVCVCVCAYTHACGCSCTLLVVVNIVICNDNHGSHATMTTICCKHYIMHIHVHACVDADLVGKDSNHTGDTNNLPMLSWAGEVSLSFDQAISITSYYRRAMWFDFSHHTYTTHVRMYITPAHVQRTLPASSSLTPT